MADKTAIKQIRMLRLPHIKATHVSKELRRILKRRRSRGHTRIDMETQTKKQRWLLSSPLRKSQ